jgi:hypothetical protein
MRERSREAPSAASLPPPRGACDEELAACAAARRAKDLDACLALARAAVRKDGACGPAWAFLCRSLFELRCYDAALAATRRALAHHHWALRERRGIAALRLSCQLLSELTPAVGERLRDGWCATQPRAE